MNASQKKPIKISIVTIVFNDAENILETLNSVRNQDYENIEYIVIDGDSIDGTKEIIEKNLQHIDKFFSEKDEGIYDALNKGIHHASGEYIGFLHSGDFFHGNDVISSLALNIEREGCDAIFSNLDIIHPKDTKKIIRHYTGNNFSLLKLRMGIMPPHPTFYCKKDIYEKVGKYTTKYRVSSDYEMMVRMFYVERIKYFYLDKTTVKMRSGGESNNGIKGQIQQNMEIYDAAKRNNFYTNYLLIACKIPLKLAQYITRS